MIWRIEKRTAALARPHAWLFPVSLAFAVAAGACIFSALGVSPLAAYGTMARGAFGSFYHFSEVVVRAIPLMLTGLAVAVAATMLLWNIGCEGQLVWGGIFAAGTGLYLIPHLPPFLAIPAVIAAGAAGGLLWGLIPGLLRAYLAVNEILSSLLLNYIAIIFMEHLYFGPWRNPEGFGFPGTAQIGEAARIPHWFGTRIHLGLVLALVMAALVFAALRYTRWGYQVRAIGLNPQAARYAGFRIRGQIVFIMGLSGALAGLAGMAEVSGIHFRLQQGLAVGYGYDGIIVAWLARLNPLAVPLVALLLGALIVGGEQLQSVLHLPASISMVLEAVLLFGLLLSESLARYRLVRRAAGEETSAAGKGLP
ncbi:MAG: ABC transporter permease [Desulfobacteraceae bacterium]|nr:ABC transporter permease [Desulfobacteraceae bacterium]